MRATSYCGRGTGEKEINRYGQKERTLGKGSEGSANRNSFRVSDGHSKLPVITPATHLQPTESWHSVPCHSCHSDCEPRSTKQIRIMYFTSYLFQDFIQTRWRGSCQFWQLKCLRVEIKMRYVIVQDSWCVIRYASRYGRKDSESAGAGGDGQSLSFQHHCKL